MNCPRCNEDTMEIVKKETNIQANFYSLFYECKYYCGLEMRKAWVLDSNKETSISYRLIINDYKISWYKGYTNYCAISSIGSQKLITCFLFKDIPLNITEEKLQKILVLV